MNFPSIWLATVSALIFVSCSTPSGPQIPGPSSTVTRQDAVATAYTYTQVAWTPEQRHLLHGPDKAGIVVQTPDTSLPINGWWKPGEPAKGVPYQWGGFDTPQQFLSSIRRGQAAGDVSTPLKRQLGDAGTSKQACGIDCSGFVSRCWRLSRPYSTQELPQICDPLKSWDDLKPGDIVLNDKHVLLFARWSRGHTWAYFYEAGPKPVWRVNAAEIPVESLRTRGYSPWRYHGIRD
jgi:hypothetical protein